MFYSDYNDLVCTNFLEFYYLTLPEVVSAWYTDPASANRTEVVDLSEQMEEEAEDGDEESKSAPTTVPVEQDG